MSFEETQDTILSPGGKRLRRNIWQDAQDVEVEVKELYAAIVRGQEQETQMLRIAKHLALEPQLLQQVNPIRVSESLLVCFCPNHADVEIKQKRANNNLLCEFCAQRKRYKTVKEEGVSPSGVTADSTNASHVNITTSSNGHSSTNNATDATPTNTNINDSTTSASNSNHTTATSTTAPFSSVDPSSRVKFSLLHGGETLERYNGKSVVVKQLHRALVRAHARIQQQAIIGAVANNDIDVDVGDQLHEATSSVVDALSPKKGELQMRSLLEEVLLKDTQVC